MITVFGSTNLDQIGTVPRLPQPGETVAGGVFSMAAGGKGANQALAARRAGAQVRHVSAVGRDSFADAALALLDAGGVDLEDVRRSDGATGIAMIFVDAAGENVIAVLPGANGTITTADAETALAGMDEDDLLLVQQEVPQAATRRALELAREKGVTSVLNTAPFLDDTPALAPLADILVANETEFALLTGRPESELEGAMVDWHAKHNQTLIVTLGGAGVKAIADGQLLDIAALPIKPVDTVGAGDTFCGYLGAGLHAGLDLPTALRRAAAAGSLACLKPGAQPAIPLAEEIDRALGD